MKSILHSLEVEIESETENELQLRVPTYRIDVTRDVDVIEDILRIYGYNNVEISDSLKANLSYQTPTDRKQKLQTLVSEQLTANGFHEIMNNSLTKKSYYESRATYPAKNSVSLVNPLSNDLGVMRQTLLFGDSRALPTTATGSISTFAFMNSGTATSTIGNGRKKTIYWPSTRRSSILACGYAENVPIKTGRPRKSKARCTN